MQRILTSALSLGLLACSAPDSSAPQPAPVGPGAQVAEGAPGAASDPGAPSAGTRTDAAASGERVGAASEIAPQPQASEGDQAPAPAAAERAAGPRQRRPHPGGLLLPAEEQQRAREAFALLSPVEQAGLVEALASDCRSLGTFQVKLLDYVLGQEDVDPGLRPDAPAPVWFDPETHAPAQPIPRKLLAADSRAVAIAEREILGVVPPRSAQRGWAYDYGRREVVRLAEERDPWRVFENALCGLPPYWDLAEALVEARLDDGTYQKVLAAFGHAYTDRVGGVYPNITLYDAWISRAPIEAPDVDTLGIMHEVLGDWETFKSIVPESQHEDLFGRLGGLVMPAYHHRSLRHALARTFVCGSTELRDGYQQHRDNFHALWESVSSDPAALADLLPDEARWTDFLLGLSSRAAQEELFALRGLRRRDALDRDGDAVRRWLYWLLEQADAYRRLDAAR